MIVATTKGTVRIVAVGVAALMLPALMAGVDGEDADGAVVRSGASLARAGTVTELVSMSSEGAQGNDDSGLTFIDGYAVSWDGRFVAFTSWASNLVADDTNTALDVFVRDRVTGDTERVSVSTTGRQGHGRSFAVDDMSADGRYVMFESSAENLVADDTNRKPDVFVRDRQEGTTVRVSVGSHGEQANRGSLGGAISADGRLVAFSSNASNLVRRDTNQERDVFVRDLVNGRTRRVSVSTQGEQGNGPSFVGALSRTGSSLRELRGQPRARPWSRRPRAGPAHRDDQTHRLHRHIRLLRVPGHLRRRRRRGL